MIQVFWGMENLPDEFNKSVAALGVFDGLHRAHWDIINRTVQEANSIGAQSMMITFDPHPRKVINHSKKFLLPILTTPEEKVDILKNSGLDAILFLKTTPEFLEQSKGEFVQLVLAERLKLRKVIVGYDYHFGKDRDGNAEFLKEKGLFFGIEAIVIPPILIDGEIVKSSIIRKLLFEGNMGRAWELLGRPYSISGVVVRGTGRGKIIGFPTTNVKPSNSEKLIPARGVYFTRVHVKKHVSYGMCNVGTRITFNETEPTIEVNLFNSPSTDLYDQEIQIEFLQRLRDEIKFKSVDELKKQLILDKVTCIRRINEMEDKLNGINERYQKRVS